MFVTSLDMTLVSTIGSKLTLSVTLVSNQLSRCQSRSRFFLKYILWISFFFSLSLSLSLSLVVLCGGCPVRSFIVCFHVVANLGPYSNCFFCGLIEISLSYSSAVLKQLQTAGDDQAREARAAFIRSLSPRASARASNSIGRKVIVKKAFPDR